MQTSQVITSITTHWQLSLLFIVLLLLLVSTEIRNRLVGAPRLSPSEVTQAINHQSAVLLDLRNQDLFMQGHILGSINRPWSEFGKQLQTLDMNKQTPVIAICENGHISQRAATLLRKAGFSRVSSLNGGILAWRNASLPLAKKAAKHDT